MNLETNIDMVKGPEYVYEEEIAMNFESRYDSRNDARPTIPFELGENSFTRICDLSSTINILTYHAYKLVSYFIDDPDLEPTNARLSSGTNKKFKGILHTSLILTKHPMRIRFMITYDDTNEVGECVFKHKVRLL
jgi:hypothetical protein